jgi:hypothetical protein
MSHKHICNVASEALVLRMGGNCRELSKSQVLDFQPTSFSSLPSSTSRNPPRPLVSFRSSGHVSVEPPPRGCHQGVKERGPHTLSLDCLASKGDQILRPSGWREKDKISGHDISSTCFFQSASINAVKSKFQACPPVQSSQGTTNPCS